MALVRYCILNSSTNVCTQTFDWEDTSTYYPATGTIVAGNNTGEVGQTYSGGASAGGTWSGGFIAPSGGTIENPGLLAIVDGGTGASTAATALSNLGAASALSVTVVPENAQTGTTYTLVLADAGKLVTLSNAAAITLTIPTNASVAFPVDTRIDLLQYGAGQVTVGGAGVTIRSSGSKLKLAGQYSGATIWKKDTDEWVLIGDIVT
jgi:hypothetical protein